MPIFTSYRGDQHPDSSDSSVLLKDFEGVHSYHHMATDKPFLLAASSKDPRYDDKKPCVYYCPERVTLELAITDIYLV